MKDIAREVGVSQATVSQVLAGRVSEFRISTTTAARIRRVAQELGYRPSALARSFKNHRAYSVCLAVGDLTNPFWAGLAMGAQQEAEVRGYTLVITDTGDTEAKERRVVDMVRERRVDGAILAPSDRRSHHLGVVTAERLPVVFVDRVIDDVDVPSVITDNVAGMRLAIDHLVSRGHREIAYLSGPTVKSTFRDRLAGYERALAQHGLAAGPIAVAPDDNQEAVRTAAELFAEGIRATAVIAANFWLTVGALRAAPPDVVIVGFDDLFLADLLRRPVTTVAQPVTDLGRHAVRLLLEPADGERHIMLPPLLVVRD